MNTTSHPTGEKRVGGVPDYDTTEPTARPSFMTRIRNSRLFQRILRTLQFLSAFTSLILFSIRIAKVHRLVGRISHASGAVEGILTAAVLYTLIVTAIQCLLRNKNGGGPSLLRWLLIALDILFVGAFIAVADLTSRHHGGDSAPCTKSDGRVNQTIGSRVGGGAACHLPWGTFGLAIFSTLLHLATAVFHQVKETRKQKKLDRLDHEAQVTGH